MNNNNRPRRNGSSGNQRRRSFNSSSRPSSNGGKFRGRNSGHSNRNRRSKRKIPTFDPSQFINTNPVEYKDEVYVPKYSFETIGLDPRLAKIVAGLGFTEPSPIQDQIIPEVLAGRDVIGLAETGTGKTAAFLLPVIHKTLSDYNRQTLILTPTRELALQINEELRKLSPHMKMYSTTCVGGVNIGPQIKSLRRTNQFVIGTPGRVLDLINRGDFDTSKVTTVVLDEADRMLDMGFINDMKKILGGTPDNRETLFFSATMTDQAKGLVHEFLNNPVTVSVKKQDVTDSIEQNVVPFQHDDKFQTLTELLAQPEFKRVIIFGQMKHSVSKLAKELSASNIAAESIHGNKTHGQRQQALNKFKSGNARVLVATDVVARGIHVDAVSHVINYDLPTTFEDYVHRIGRTGRGSKRGKALTFVPAK
jgi:ATP-dependent RNA helicase RhlE